MWGRDMDTLQVSLFGKMSVSWAGGTEDLHCGSTKARELFAYLALHRERPHSRERLGSLLWNHVSTKRSKAYLRKALWQLQHAPIARPFGAPAPSDGGAAGSETPEGLLVVDGSWVQLNPRARIWLDVDVFEAAFRAVRDQDVDAMSPAVAEALQQAVALYTSDLLENWYRDWCLLERERLQDVYLMALGKLAHYAERHGSYDTGIGYGLRMLEVDPARECAHRRLMRLRYLSGDRTGALRQYVRCADVLDAELGVQPSTATRQLYENVQSDALHPAPEPNSPSRPPTASDGLDRIRALQQKLQGLQSQIRREIEAVEMVIERRR